MPEANHVPWCVHCHSRPSRGGASRIVPLFNGLAEVLREGFEQAEDGSRYVIHRYHTNVNLGTRFKKIVSRAGLEPWPKLFVNLRSSRQTELAERYPEWQVCRIMGNSEKVASNHYLQLRDEHIQAMTESHVNSHVEGNRTGRIRAETASPRSSFHADFTVEPEENGLSLIPPRGAEQSQNSPGNTHGEGESGTVCGTPNVHSALIDADLRAIVDRWANLPDELKSRIVAVVRAAGD